MPNKFYAYLLNVEPSNVVFWNFNTQFDEIIITFMNQNGRKLEIPDKANSLLTNRNYVLFYRTKKIKYIQGLVFFSFARNYRKHMTKTGTGLDALKTASKKVVNEVAGATGEVIRNKYAEKIVK